MDPTTYRDAVVENRRTHGFEVVDEHTGGFDPLWKARAEDATLGQVVVLATLQTRQSVSPSELTELADAFRAVVAEQVDRTRSSTTPIGYLVVGVPDPDPNVVEAATSYTVAERRTNVFPIVYDCDAEQLHCHDVPRLKGRGIYQRQATDAERLFAV